MRTLFNHRGPAALLLLVSLLGTGLASAQERPELYVETNHVGGIANVEFSPDGNLMATVGSDSPTVKLWSAKTGKQLRTLRSREIEFSPDGKHFAVDDLNFEKDVIVFDAATGAQKFELDLPDVLGCEFALGAGSSLVTSCEDGAVRTWDVSTGLQLKSFVIGGSSTVTALALSPTGKVLTSIRRREIDPGTGEEKYIDVLKLWDAEVGKELQEFDLTGVESSAGLFSFSADEKLLLSTDLNSYQYIAWRVDTGKTVADYKREEGNNLAFNADKRVVARIVRGGAIEVLNVESGKVVATLDSPTQNTLAVALSSDAGRLASVDQDGLVVLWDVGKGRIVGTARSSAGKITFHPSGAAILIGGWDGNLHQLSADTLAVGANSSHGNVQVYDAAVSPDGEYVASGNKDHTIKLWSLRDGRELRVLTGHHYPVMAVRFSPDGKTLASASGLPSHTMEATPEGAVPAGRRQNYIKLWDVATGAEKASLPDADYVMSLAFSPDGKLLAAITARGNSLKVWNLRTREEVLSVEIGAEFAASVQVAFSTDGKRLITIENLMTAKLWDLSDGKLLESTAEEDTPAGGPGKQFESLLAQCFSNESKELEAQVSDGAKIRLSRTANGEQVVTLTALTGEDWVVNTPDGRFDTNIRLDEIRGLHWLIPNDLLVSTLPLEVFMRQYYEPGLLGRALKCAEGKSCGREFKPLPSIAEINRVQPRVTIRAVELSATPFAVDVSVEVERVSEEVTGEASGGAQKRTRDSGAYDLRLFRDGQLVGVSTPKDKLAAFIAAAPRLVAETAASGRLVDTPEDRAWREANDIFLLKSENVKTLAPGKLEYTFRGVKLPRGGTEVEFTAYAFNSDKVKSMTAPPARFAFPGAAAGGPKKGRAVLVSIGVNASENPAYNLRYAANDARKMQEVLGGQLGAGAKYSEVVLVPLISDYGPGRRPAENNARKEVIRGVFSLLAGDGKEVPADVLRQVPGLDKIKPLEPEDTLVITFAGHGYADPSGIFYLLPYDIGGQTTRLTTDTLRKLISSDELSLWLRDITAAQMVMVIDACHSSAAVQGDGFKPGPMGSRGLGQLAYDKGMKVLSATQADNVALELNALEQGLLSYALLRDGIAASLADADGDGELHASEWLSFAERRVPELYREVKDGKRGVFIDGGYVRDGGNRAQLFSTGAGQSSLNLQQPSLFDFKRRRKEKPLLTLPIARRSVTNREQFERPRR